jgi:DNA modification methylase
VWEFSRVTGEERHGHATPKPVAMMERVMKSSLPSGGLCVEPFGGSGSTLIGAEKAGRVCYAMELNPVYVDVIVKRWEDFTGNTAVCVPSDQHFTEQQEAF